MQYYYFALAENFFSESFVKSFRLQQLQKSASISSGFDFQVRTIVKTLGVASKSAKKMDLPDLAEYLQLLSKAFKTS